MLNKSGKSLLFSDRGAGYRPPQDEAENDPHSDAHPPPDAPWEAHAALASALPSQRQPTRDTNRADDTLRRAVRKLQLEPGMLLFAVRAYPNLREVLLDPADLDPDWPHTCAAELPGGVLIQGKLSTSNPWRIIRFGGSQTEFPIRVLRLRPMPRTGAHPGR